MVEALHRITAGIPSNGPAAAIAIPSVPVRLEKFRVNVLAVLVSSVYATVMLKVPATKVVMLTFPWIRNRPSAAPTVKARREAIAAVWAV